MKPIALYTFALLFAAEAAAQTHQIFKESIATLQVVADNDRLSPPIARLNSGTVSIAFDDLTHEYHRYTYSIEHCEADWTTSKNLFATDYIEGFAEGNTIDDVQKSVNTKTLYTHYRLQIPNTKCRIKLSGNYRLNVYDESDGNRKILSACFMIVEPLATIGLNIATNTDIDIDATDQQANMTIDFAALRATDPAVQLKTVVMQNGRFDDARIDVKPQYTQPGKWRWEHCRQLIFEAGNEYRKFETLDVDHPTMGVESVGWDGADYHAYLWTDEPRPSYVYDEDANGAFYIRNSENRENNTLSEYQIVHFKLQAPRQPGHVYIDGAWTVGPFAPEYRMEYNERERCSEKAGLLKHGYYSYRSLVRTADGSTANVSSEGNFYQTENKYQALLYFRAAGERTDRLVGYRQVRFK